MNRVLFCEFIIQYSCLTKFFSYVGDCIFHIRFFSVLENNIHCIDMYALTKIVLFYKRYNHITPCHFGANS